MGRFIYVIKHLAVMKKSLDYINNSPLKTVREIGDLLQSFRKGKAEESCR